jgi:hypothetical protein
MSKKLKLSPRVAYMLAIYSYSGSGAIGVMSKHEAVTARFLKLVMEEYGIEPNRILFEETEQGQLAYFYNSKLQKLFEKTLERKEVVFKYKNDYSAAYFAGIYDERGSKGSRQYCIEGLRADDSLLLERLGFHTKWKNRRAYITNGVTFIEFIRPFSARFSDGKQ